MAKSFRKNNDSIEDLVKFDLKWTKYDPNGIETRASKNLARLFYFWGHADGITEALQIEPCGVGNETPH